MWNSQEKCGLEIGIWGLWHISDLENQESEQGITSFVCTPKITLQNFFFEKEIRLKKKKGNVQGKEDISKI